MLPSHHESGDTQTAHTIQPRPSSLGRKWLIGGGFALLALAVLVYAAPWLIATTELRNSLLARLLPPEKVTLRSEQAILSWTRPLSVQGLRINLPQEDLQVKIQRVELENAWWQVVRKAPHFGAVRLVQPVIDLGVEKLLKPTPLKRDREMPPFSLQASVEAATVRMRAENLKLPVLEFENIDARVEVTAVDGHSVLQVGRTQFLDHYVLTAELCDQGLQLLAPILADISRVEGRASLEFDSLRIPLSGKDRLMDVRGTLRLHNVTTGLSNPLLQEVLGNMASLFDFEMPETVRIAEDAVVRFAVANDRVEHESIHFKLPALTGDRLWRSSGSVGLDESLDLEIEAPIPMDAVSDSAIAKLLSAKPLRLHVGGTISQPDLTLPEDSSFLDQLGDALIGTDQEDDFETALTRVEAALETGEAIIPLWEWTSQWFSSDADADGQQ